MATVQQMAMERASKRWPEPKGSEDEILNYFQGYSQGAYDILNMFKEIINMGFGIDGLNYYIEKRLGEMKSDEDERPKCKTVVM